MCGELKTLASTFGSHIAPMAASLSRRLNVPGAFGAETNQYSTADVYDGMCSLIL